MVGLTNLEEYRDAAVYDLEHPRWGPEGPFYLEFARQAVGPVLELGCGTGRLTIPFAQEGIEIVGVDLAPAMLARAREKAGALPIRWVEADIRTFQLGRQFQLIFTIGFVFHHLLTRADQEAALARVREHLAPDGQFVVDIWFLHPESLVDNPAEKAWYSYVDQNGVEVKVSGVERYDAVQQIWDQTIYRRWLDAAGKQRTRRTKLAMRYIFPQEMEALLHYNGLRLLARYGNLEWGPLSDEEGCHIYVCGRQGE
jgi:SAM-dependent methyltransferase